MRITKPITLFITYCCLLLIPMVHYGQGDHHQMMMADDLIIDQQHLQNTIKLNGIWKFYWGKLYTPAQLAQGVNDPGLDVEVPNSWTNYKMKNGKYCPDYGVATYRLLVKLPQKAMNMGLLVPKIWSAQRVYVNGQLISSRGVLDQAQYQNLIVEELVMLPDAEQLDIVLHVSNYSLFVGGIVEPFLIGNYDSVLKMKDRRGSLNLLWIGAILIMGVYHLILFIFRKTDKSALYFGIVCFLIVIKQIVFGSHYLYDYLKLYSGILSFEWQSRLYFSSNYLLPAIGMLYVGVLYPGEVGIKLLKKVALSRVARIVVMITLVYCVFLLLAPMRVYLPTLNPFQAINIVAMLYILYIITMATIRRREQAWVQALGIAVMVFAALNDFLHAFGIMLTPNPEFVPVAFGALLSLQFVILARRFSNAFTGLEKLSAQLEEKVIERTKEVTTQKEEIEKQNNNIKSSINYAHRIQKAILPPNEFIKEVLPESFIVYKPRDIVSGDFYFLEEIKTKNHHLKIIAAVDCTGHGVPGALMSMIGDTLLRKIISDKRIFEPDKILNELNLGIREALKQDITENRDGMDLALCVIDCRENIVHYAGASNPLVYVKNGEMEVIKADKKHIGGLQKGINKSFTRHSVIFDSPMTFYIYTDGFQDQFGGPDGQKYMAKRLRRLLHEHSHLSLGQQGVELENTLERWMGETHPQIDDVLVIGFRVAPGMA